MSAEVFLKLFGEHFFIFCKQAGYDTMLRTLGGNLIEFIGNLDALHSYLALSYQVRSPVRLVIDSRIILVKDSLVSMETESEREREALVFWF